MDRAPSNSVRVLPASRVIALVAMVVLAAQLAALGGFLLVQRGSADMVAPADRPVRPGAGLLVRYAAVSLTTGLLAAAGCAWIIWKWAPLPPSRSGTEHLLATSGTDTGGPVAGLDVENGEVARLTGKLEEARRLLEEGLVERERFLSNVSHEIKTPIAVMMIEAQTLDRRGCSNGMLRFVDTVEAETTRLGKLVENFLLLTRVQSGRGPTSLKVYGLNDMVVDSIESCTPIARQHQVTLRPTLLAHDETLDAGVVGDPDLLRTLVENLLRNSIRFSPPGTTIEVIASVDGQSAGIRVRDQGPGIPADRIKTIFDRFSKAQDSQRQGRGHGLGLAVAKGIAELHGGTIEAFNCEGGGCEFVVRLRRAHLDDE